MSEPLRVALCPHPPLLLRELSGAEDALPALREACRSAVADLTAHEPAEVVAVGAADEPGPVAADGVVDVRRFGTTGPRTAAGTALPQALGVGRRLLDDAGWAGPTTFVAVAWDAGGDELDTLAGELLGRPGAAVLLLGDGSACRDEKAPGFLDERAFGFDDTVAEALASGDPGPLRDLDPVLAAELMVGGRSVLRLLGRLGDRRPPVRAALTHREDPYGVSYLVARWDLG
jgi:hypothetical protein